MLATLLEANWALARGHNLKVTGEYLDPNRRVPRDAQTRWSLLYELTPVQFVQLRAGERYSDGIPQLDSEHTRLYFPELPGLFCLAAQRAGRGRTELLPTPGRLA